jgi:hypothetical protein
VAQGLAKDIEDLWEPWMREVDQLLEDAALVEEVYQAQGKRRPKSQTRGRTQTPAEAALRLLTLNHVRNWSYDTLGREVRANLVYRAFTRIADEKVPDAKTLGRKVARAASVIYVSCSACSQSFFGHGITRKSEPFTNRHRKQNPSAFESQFITLAKLFP